jgi:hypothetical protein
MHLEMTFYAEVMTLLEQVWATDRWWKKTMFNSFQSLYVKHANREANEAAHCLQKQQFEKYPIFIWNVVLAKQAASSWF